MSEMLKTLEKRTGHKQGATVVVDSGMAYPENLAEIRAQGLHTRQPDGRRRGTNSWKTSRRIMTGKR